jgi:hypothetical protein
MQFSSGTATDRATSKRLSYLLSGPPPAAMTFENGDEVRQTLLAAKVLRAEATQDSTPQARGSAGRHSPFSQGSARHHRRSRHCAGV